MRLWSISPSLLDKAGLGALWREGLLALNVLKGKTKGYKNHPQLVRFKECENPVQAITDYMHFICDEADSRGYSFNRHKLGTRSNNPEVIVVSAGQIRFEYSHIKNKILTRAPKEIARLQISDFINPIGVELHRMFDVNMMNDNVESWERV
jgi:hypothetical protein